MNKKVVKDTSASFRARLLNLARSTGRDFNELAVRYIVERFLARLAEIEYREKFYHRSRRIINYLSGAPLPRSGLRPSRSKGL